MIILTPNRRLAAFSQRQFNDQQLAPLDKGQQCWLTPEIYPLEVWLLQIWQLCLEHDPKMYRPVLTPKLQQLLFEQIIQQTDVSSELLRVTATAQNAIQAWGFLRQWQIDLPRLAAYADYNADSAAFYIWLQAYLQWLDDNKYYDFNLMVDCLIELVPMIRPQLPDTICMRGFNELTPQYTKLFAAFKNNNINITTDQLTTPGAEVYRSGFATAEQELQHAFAWAWQQLGANPDKTIGIVIPHLEQQRAAIVSLSHSAPRGWVNISAPLPLSNYSVIATALQILKLATNTIAFNDLSILLRSPFVADFFVECNERARLDRRMREKLEANLRWDKILDLLADELTSLKACIAEFHAQINALRGKHTATHWIAHIQKMLQSWGWPGDGYDEAAVVHHEEVDLLSCWRGLLEEYAKLSIIMPAHTFAECLQFLWRLANETPFLPAETGITKMHVLGMLEAEGLIFDQLWVCGMSRDNWPQAIDPNPFIPLELQRQFDLPHSSARRELTMAQKYTANLQQGGRDTVIFSYPMHVDDSATTASNLIMHLPEQTVPIDKTSKFIPDPLEEWQDSTAPMYTAGYISGGARSLQLQAQCPFKANAEMRLKAQPLLEPQIILTPMLRGKLVHAVLEEFWLQCKSHAQLVAYSAAELEAMLIKIIDQILEAWKLQLPATLTNSYIILEAQRLYALISRWLEFEAGRSAFAIYQLEQKTLINVGPLQINMRIDRIDQLLDGSFAIIDYKTGETQINHWFTEPIYEPQLPIYAVYVAQEISAVAFAMVRAQGMKFIGIATHDALLTNVKGTDDWPSIQQDWQRKLEQAAADFVAGNALVAPFSQQICNICKLQAFCRIYAQ